MRRSVPELLLAKRNGQALEPDEVRGLIQGFVRGEVPDYQLSAFAMAVYFKGMTREETVALTLAMRDSGVVVDLSEVSALKVDKHSTGGVGDKVSLALAPLVAACGVPVPMCSGRGLGHTGGTLDKLEAIPGFSVNLPLSRYREIVRDVGACMIGQTAELAPADKRLYALRDVTATVESIPLIVASILSKKLAEGIDGLVLDVKFGSGAFMKSVEDARSLATALVEVTRGAGKSCVAWLTRMDRPLGRAVGNALETIEAFELLHGRGPEDLREVTLTLGASMLLLGAKARSDAEARERLERALGDGSALSVARRMVAAQGGDPRAVDDPSVFPRARVVGALTATRGGYLTAVDTHAVGVCGVVLGAGRTRAEDVIDPSVGFVFARTVGDRVEPGDTLATLHVRSDEDLAVARERLGRAFTYGDRAPEPVPLVLERVG
ncbi:MAG: thymidine phosphorylase [Deltaproteobacteria bacterium]|nr:thymidine phosphorylase [Deltaproteobacteria bacterium]